MGDRCASGGNVNDYPKNFDNCHLIHTITTKINGYIPFCQNIVQSDCTTGKEIEFQSVFLEHKLPKGLFFLEYELASRRGCLRFNHKQTKD